MTTASRPPGRQRPALHVTGLIVLALLGLTTMSCTREVRFTAHHEIPRALVEAHRVTVQVHYPEALSQHVFEDSSEARGQWRIASGAAQLTMFRGVFADLFADVSETAANAHEGDGLLLEPRLTSMQFATPMETGLDFYECWLEYEILLTDAAGRLEPWRFSGYGQATDERFAGAEQGLNEALGSALRNAGARLATDFTRHPPVRRYLAADREQP